MDTFYKYGLKIPQILLPKDNNCLDKWPIIACDQYTQDKSYWEKVNKNVGETPSTLRLILPEVYLKDSDKESRIQNIRKTMTNYLENGIFNSPLSAMIYLERETEYGRIRKGIISCIDLETYEWKPFSHSLIRATEATIIERIPPRMEIRQGAPLESPHIMLLVNDPTKTLIEKTGKLAKENKKNLYDIDLMMNAGKISGWEISKNNKEIQTNLMQSLETIEKNNLDNTGSPFMFAVGDGNHSLATAKAVWEDYKNKTGKKEHPARYALVEIVNIYDSGLTFEPIHRVLYNINKLDLISFLKNTLEANQIDYSTEEELKNTVTNSKAFFGFVYTDKNQKQHYTCLQTHITDLAISHIQPAIDSYLKTQPNKTFSMDYIHGTSEVFRLGKNENALTILLPPIAKETFFQTIAHSGPLPRKSFSMGEASEKRFYMESRKLFTDA